MKRFLFLIALLILASIAQAQYIPFQEEWHKHIGMDYIPPEVTTNDKVPMAVDPSGNIIVSRRTWVGASKNDVLTIKYDTNGDTLWTRIWKYIPPSHPDTFGEHAEDVVVDNAGNIYVLVSSMIPPDVSPFMERQDMVILKYDPNGTLVDSVRWDGPGDSEEMMNMMVLNSTNGALYVGGKRKQYDVGIFDRWFVIKFDSNLDVDWYDDWIPPANMGAGCFDVIVDEADAHVYATGHTSNPGTVYDWITLKYRESSGAIVAQAVYDPGLGPPTQMDKANAITFDNTGNLIVVGYIHVGHNPQPPFSDFDFCTIKYDTNLDTVWVRTYDFITQLTDGASGVVCDASGNAYVIGAICLNNEDYDVFVIKYSPAGDTLWTARYGGPGYLSDAAIKCALNSSETELYVAGHSAEPRVEPDRGRSLNSGNDDYLLLVYDAATGEELQCLKYNGAYDYQDQAKDMVLDNSGNIFITGHTIEVADSSYFTITTCKYSRQADNTPPVSPSITKVEKVGDDAKLTWLKVTTDTLGNMENTHRYVVYRNTAPDFIPGQSDSVGLTNHPDTTFTDTGALNASQSYYYLIRAVDMSGNRSKKSNMGFKFNKPFNENPGTTSDKNWVSIPWHNNYTNASDLTDDLSPSGDPLTTITNLRDDQQFESWVYNFGWFGTDFAIISGKAYEMSDTLHDTTLVIVGANNPDGSVPLNENPGDIGDKNWICIPYNADYANASDITTEYTPLGDPLTVLTNMLNSQFFESWVYDTTFDEWNGTDFAIERGRGYEFVTIADTTWNPTEYTNSAKTLMATVPHPIRSGCFTGHRSTPDRAPLWQSDQASTTLQFAKAVHHNRIAGISHIVRGHLELEDIQNITFTAYRPGSPHDALTERMIGSAVVVKEDQGSFWFNTGNFLQPWNDDEEVLLIVEVNTRERAFVHILLFNLNRGVDIQELGMLKLEPLPEPVSRLNVVSWNPIDNPHIIGYSLYDKEQRLNKDIITETSFVSSLSNPSLRLIIRGGYETISGSQTSSSPKTPVPYSLTTYPNPFVKNTIIQYSVARSGKVEIEVFDVSGKKIRTLLSKNLDTGCYEIRWIGNNQMNKPVSNGIYFIRISTQSFSTQKKVILVR